MVTHFLSKSAITKLMKNAAPGAYTPESVEKTREITEDLITAITKSAKEITNNAGKKRVTETEIKIATKYFLKQ